MPIAKLNYKCLNAQGVTYLYQTLPGVKRVFTVLMSFWHSTGRPCDEETDSSAESVRNWHGMYGGLQRASENGRKEVGSRKKGVIAGVSLGVNKHLFKEDEIRGGQREGGKGHDSQLTVPISRAATSFQGSRTHEVGAAPRLKDVLSLRSWFLHKSRARILITLHE
ncbi:hypothetical protein J6590_003694 [Homalodisca vitripennis]|nr:hypothetical protein J6590_003694 [Homalodisca vitripennis]